MRALWFWVGALALALAIFRLFWPAFTACFQTRDNWAISVYRGRRPFQLEPHPDVGNRPVVTASDVTDAQAEFVADPFMIRRDGRWLMMFEVMERGRWAGSLAYAESDNGTTWKYGRVVLREPFHLSYPQIIEDDDGELYLIPESAQAGSLRLYHAAHFPESWVFVAELLPGQHRDATVFRDGGSWWMYSTDSSHSCISSSRRHYEGPGGSIRPVRWSRNVVEVAGVVARWSGWTASCIVSRRMAASGTGARSAHIESIG